MIALQDSDGFALSLQEAAPPIIPERMRAVVPGN
jgi:hypothetical protein